MSIREIYDPSTGQILARHVTSDEWSNGGLVFHSKDTEFLQVGTWNYDANKQLPGHTHKLFLRSFDRTHETLYIRRGRIEARIFDEKLAQIARLEVNEGDLLILMSGGHGYTILDDGTQVLEIKNGPYVGAEADRVRFESI